MGHWYFFFFCKGSVRFYGQVDSIADAYFFFKVVLLKSCVRMASVNEFHPFLRILSIFTGGRIHNTEC